MRVCKTYIFLFTVILIPLLTTCGTLDLTKGLSGSSPICGIHNVEMHKETIKANGEIVYVLDYLHHMQKHFPHHGGHRYNGEAEKTPRNRDVIDWVCPVCHEKYLQYWKMRKP